jgi:two-component system, LytTR family, sensor histidine kinase AlgZ
MENGVEERFVTMSSIRQNVYPDVLPDFRNLGVIARVLLAVNALVLASALFASPDVGAALESFMNSAAFVGPLLLACLAALAALSPALARLPYWLGYGAVLATVLAVAWALHLIAATSEFAPRTDPWRSLVLATLVAAGLLGYFRLLAKAFSPALAEARLQALQARIRPHFLFNSLNAVLSIIRRDPRRAERSLEDLADLFRTLMSDGRQFVRLSDEIALLERYATLEELRLGERLRITWELDAAPADAMLPPLILQPLLENAVYHGVEPGTGLGDVLVRIERRGTRVRACIENPYAEEHAARAGNRMALENIRERLALFFDAEAMLRTEVSGRRYRVEIEMPYRRA